MILAAGFIAPAVTSLKSGSDITDGAYTIKSALEQARAYAVANNTYTWLGFAGSIGTTITGQVHTAIVASNDGSRFVCTGSGSSTTRLGTDDPAGGTIVVGSGPGSVTQIGKAMTVNNGHVGDTGVPTNSGSEFESRPNVSAAYRISAAGTTRHPFTVQTTTFGRWIQFSPRGEAVVNGDTTNIALYAEVGLLSTHSSSLSSSPNIVAVQLSGFGGEVRVYRR